MKILLIKIFLLLNFFSCSLLGLGQRGVPDSWDNPVDKNYELIDPSGNFRWRVEKKVVKNIFVFRSSLYSSFNSDLPLEKNVSLLKQDDSKKGYFPSISQFTTWYEKKKYFTQIKYDWHLNKLFILTKSPEKKYNGKREFNIPKNKAKCFYSSLIDCLIVNKLIDPQNVDRSFLIIWDMYPFQNIQYSELSPEPFQAAKVENIQEGKMMSFDIVLENQLINVYLDEEQNIKRFYWTAQGLTIKE